MQINFCVRLFSIHFVVLLFNCGSARIFSFRIEKIIQQKTSVSTLVPQLLYITDREFERSLGTQNVCSFNKLSTFLITAFNYQLLVTCISNSLNKAIVI